MGYYTYFDFSCYDEYHQRVNFNNEKEFAQKILNALSEINPNYFDSNSSIGECFCDSMKWYDHEEDMVELSKRFPNYTFLLEGEGEERDDRWRAVYHNGQIEVIYARYIYEAPQSDFAQFLYNEFNDMEE